MAFDSTISGVDANSYISVAVADAYFAFHLDGATYWNSLPTVTKQAALVQATNRIDSEQFSGRPTKDDQRLQFPRSFLVNRNQYPSQTRIQEIGGLYYLPNDRMPKELMDATCEMALAYLKIQAGENTVDENDLETLKSMKIGPIDVTIKDNLKADRLPSKVKALLSAIGTGVWLGSQPLTYVR